MVLELRGIKLPEFSHFANFSYTKIYYEDQKLQRRSDNIQLNQARSKLDIVHRLATASRSTISSFDLAWFLSLISILLVPFCTTITVHNTAAQRQFTYYSPSSRPTSHLRCGQVKVRGWGYGEGLCPSQVRVWSGNGLFFLPRKTRSSAVTETARRFVSLNILLSHSRSLKVIRNDTVA